MKILAAFPPNFKEIVKRFPSARGNGIIYTYGDTIYNPSRIVIPPSIIAHEEIHSKRQGTNPKVIEEWWGQYLRNVNFRFKEELLAHKEEFRWFINSSLKEKKTALNYIARRLSSPLYGKMTDFGKAKELLQEVHKL